jgi:hypothetical protein
MTLIDAIIFCLNSVYNDDVTPVSGKQINIYHRTSCIMNEYGLESHRHVPHAFHSNVHGYCDREDILQRDSFPQYGNLMDLHMNLTNIQQQVSSLNKTLADAMNELKGIKNGYATPILQNTYAKPNTQGYLHRAYPHKRPTSILPTPPSYIPGFNLKPNDFPRITRTHNMPFKTQGREIPTNFQTKRTGNNGITRMNTHTDTIPLPHRKTIIKDQHQTAMVKNFTDETFPIFKIIRGYINNRHSFRLTKKRMNENKTIRNMESLCNPIYGQILQKDISPEGADIRKHIKELINQACIMASNYNISKHVTVDHDFIDNFKSHFISPSEDLDAFINLSSKVRWRGLTKRKMGKQAQHKMQEDMDNLLKDEPRFIGEEVLEEVLISRPHTQRVSTHKPSIRH